MLRITVLMYVLKLFLVCSLIPNTFPMIHNYSFTYHTRFVMESCSYFHLLIMVSWSRCSWHEHFLYFHIILQDSLQELYAHPWYDVLRPWKIFVMFRRQTSIRSQHKSCIAQRPLTSSDLFSRWISIFFLLCIHCGSQMWPLLYFIYVSFICWICSCRAMHIFVPDITLCYQSIFFLCYVWGFFSAMLLFLVTISWFSDPKVVTRTTFVVKAKNVHNSI